ncbi:MAG: MMPL family transporter [Byssovorax sp.]
MLNALGNLMVKKSVAWATVIAVFAITLVSLVFAARVEQDDNLLAFLPQSNPDIKTFYDVNNRFGGLSVALVGIHSDDPFSADFLGRLKTASKQLNETEGIDFAFSLATVDDFVPDPVKGGIGVSYLVDKLPETPAEKEALREKIMSRDQVVGNLIARDGKAVLLYCFLAYGADPKAAAGKVREVVSRHFPNEAKYWGGSPFIQSYIFSVTQADLRKLGPWACAVIILITIWSFRDGIGTGLALLSTAMGIAVARGLMGAFGVKENLILGSMPIILFALGSAYPIHILTRYYTVAGSMGCEGALKHAIGYLGPTVIASGLTVVAGLLSFVLMDMKPVQDFGLFTGIGVLVTLLLGVTFVPAVVRIAELKGKMRVATPTSSLMVKFCTVCQQKPWPVGIGLVVLALASGVFVGRLDSRIDNSSFYTAKSPPAEAEAFLKDHFGGSQFFQVEVDGDMSDPDALRELRMLGDEITMLPHVTSVNHVAAVVAKMDEAMEGDERIPDTAAKVKLLYGFLAGKKAVNQLVTEDRKRALMHIKVDSDRAADLEALLAQVDGFVKEKALTRYVSERRDGPRKSEVEARIQGMVTARIRALAAQLGVALPPEKMDELKKRLAEPAADDAGDREPAKAAVLAFLGSEEFLGTMPSSPADAPARVAGALALLPAHASPQVMGEALGKALDLAPTDAVVTGLVSDVEKPVAEIMRRQMALARARKLLGSLKLALPEGGKGQRFTVAVGAALMDLDNAAIALPVTAGEPTGTLALQVTGLPVLNRGLSDSVDKNQLRAFFVTMGLVFLIVLYLYRSVWSALLSMAPVSLTLVIIYGAMGFFGIHLDVGTSMLASLTTGAGVDYALHLLAAWKAPPGGSLRDAASYSAFLVGRAIWTNAIMVAVGFVVLTMGEARPLQNVGGLTAAAMVVAALATFATIPVLARRSSYDSRARIAGIMPSSTSTDAEPGALAPHLH